MPAQKPGESKQDYGTPRVFLDAVERRYGPLVIDLAAREDNKKCPYFISPEDDALVQDWGALAQGDNCWLNPPFGEIPAFAAKCAAEGARGTRIFFLVPSSVGTNWYWDHVHGQSLVLQIGRLSFDGSDGQVYPKDLMLCAFGLRGDSRENAPGEASPRIVGFERWQWRGAHRAA